MFSIFIFRNQRCRTTGLALAPVVPDNNQGFHLAAVVAVVTVVFNVAAIGCVSGDQLESRQRNPNYVSL